MKYSIYTLSDPRDTTIRYVGLSKNPYRRFAMHLLNVNGTHFPKDEWIAELREIGQAPILTVIETDIPSHKEALSRETYWIQRYKNEGVPLLNLAHGVLIPPQIDREVVDLNIYGAIIREIRNRPNEYERCQLAMTIREIVSAMGGRVIDKWYGVHTDPIAHIFSQVPGKRHKMISMGMSLNDFIYLPEDELLKRIINAIALSEGRNEVGA